jgi:multiple sugar transport system ATP-binding protein
VHGEQITVAVDARRAKAGDAVSLGIRPEHLLAGDVGAGSPLHAKVRQMERLGDSSMLYLDIAPDAPMVTLRLEGYAGHSAGERITLRVRPEHGYLFDAAGLAFERTVQLPA